MSKEVTKKEQAQAPSVFAAPSSQAAQIDRSDILIPKLLLMQGLSELVAEEKAAMGDLVNSVTGQVLGGKGKPLSFIPLTHTKDIARLQLIEGDSKPKFRGTLPWTAENAEIPWERDEAEGKFRYVKRLNFYVILESEVNNPAALPYLLSFMSTSYQNGRKLVTHFAQASMSNLRPASFMFNLDTKKEKNEKGIYYILDVAPNKATPVDYAPKIVLWEGILAQNQHEVDNSDFETTATAEATPTQKAPSKNPQASAQF